MKKFLWVAIPALILLGAGCGPAPTAPAVYPPATKNTLEAAKPAAAAPAPTPTKNNQTSDCFTASGNVIFSVQDAGQLLGGSWKLSPDAATTRNLIGLCIYNLQSGEEMPTSGNPQDMQNYLKNIGKNRIIELSGLDQKWFNAGAQKNNDEQKTLSDATITPIPVGEGSFIRTQTGENYLGYLTSLYLKKNSHFLQISGPDKTDELVSIAKVIVERW